MGIIRLGALSVIAVLALATSAAADSKVDWSQYLESPAERAAAKKPVAKQAKPTPVAKAAPAKRVAQKPRAAKAAKPRRR